MGRASTRIGFIGVGQMGRPILDRMVAARLPVAAFVRQPVLAADLVAQGVTVADDPAELAASVEVLVLCTFSDEQLRSVVYESGVLAALRPGAILINHVTGSPALAEELVSGAPAGVRIVDAPMSGTAEDIRRGALTLLVGADNGDLAAVRPMMATYAAPIVHVGRVGDGQRVKLVNNLLFTAHLFLAREAVNLGATMGISASALVAAIGQCSGASRALAVLDGRPADAVVNAARPYLAKDVGALTSVAAELGLDLGRLGELAAWVGPA